MAGHHGKFVWYELMTTDTKAAETFYKDVVGWDARDAGMPGVSYTLFTKGERQVAGLMTMPEGALEMNVPPAWLGYIGVEDVDAAAATVAAKGGRSTVRPTTSPASAASPSPPTRMARFSPCLPASATRRPPLTQ